MNKVVVITGGSSGIGLSIAKELSKDKCTVYELSRRQSEERGINHISADITDFEAVKEVINRIISKEGKIDVLINNAGFGISGATEFTSVEQAKKLMEVNFWGLVNITKEILPYMRKQNFGKIINISSVAAIMPIPFQTYYSLSKSAINSFTMGLANEVKTFNVYVSAVMLGDVKTGFTKAREKEEIGDDVYSGKINKSVSKMEKDEQNGMKPEKIALFICKLIKKEKAKAVYTVGAKYKAVVILSKILPNNFVNKIIGKIYAE